MPSIKAGETEKQWIARCMSHLISKEEKTNDQAAGQCFGMWRHKKEDIVSKLDCLIGDAITGGAITTGNVEKNLARGHVDIIGAGCPEGFNWSKSKKVCVKETANEGARNPKTGDRFISKKGKKLTVIEVGSGILALAGNNIEVQFDGEKITRDVKMTKFFKDFKFISEDRVVHRSNPRSRKSAWFVEDNNGSVIGGPFKTEREAKKHMKEISETIAVAGTYGNSNTPIAGSGQSRTVGDKTGIIPILRRFNKSQEERSQPRALRFSILLGAYLPSDINKK